MKILLLYTDGAARGNPGPAGAGWVIKSDQGEFLAENCRFLGELTNNQAEYRALLLALEEAQKLKGDILRLFADSELMVRQLKGEYKVKNEGLRPLFQQAVLTLAKFREYTIDYIPREQNSVADALANRAIDGSAKSLKM